MASTESINLVNILFDRASTTVEIADGIKSLNNSGTDNYEQQLNTLAGSAGLSSTTTSLVPKFYLGMHTTALTLDEMQI